MEENVVSLLIDDVPKIDSGKGQVGYWIHI